MSEYRDKISVGIIRYNDLDICKKKIENINRLGEKVVPIIRTKIYIYSI